VVWSGLCDRCDEERVNNSHMMTSGIFRKATLNRQKFQFRTRVEHAFVNWLSSIMLGG
jgi:hypothetical protein